MCLLGIKTAGSSSSTTLESCISFSKASASRFSAVGDFGSETSLNYNLMFGIIRAVCCADLMSKKPVFPTMRVQDLNSYLHNVFSRPRH